MQEEIINSIINNLHYYVIFLSAIGAWIISFIVSKSKKDIFDSETIMDKKLESTLKLSMILILFFGFIMYGTIYIWEYLSILLFFLGIILFTIFATKNRKELIMISSFIISFSILVFLIYFSHIEYYLYFLLVFSIIFLMFFSVSIILFKETQFPIKFYKITLQGKNKKIDKCIILYDKDNKLTIKKYNKISFINKDDIKEMEEVKNN